MQRHDIKAHSDASRFKYDTDEIGERERFEYYREVMAQNLLRLTPERPANGTVSATIDGVALDDRVSVSRVELSPHLVRRTAADLARSNQDLYHLGLNYGGSLYRTIEGEPRLRKQNDLYFSDSSVESEYLIRGTSNVKLLCILFPKTLVSKYTKIELAGGIDISRNSKTSAIFKSVSLLSSRLSTASIGELNAITSATISLLAASLMAEADRSHAFGTNRSANEGMLILAKDAIERSLALHHLSVGLVADRLGISVRYLQKIFEGDNSTFHRYVVERRLDRIRTDLLSKRFQQESVMRIAEKWGIADPTTLRRNYKSRFDETPHQTRLTSRDIL